MRKIFAELKKMLAYVDLERMNLGVVVHKIIREDIIPRLKKKLSRCADAESDRIERLIAEYEKYSDPKTEESKVFSKTAADVVRAQAVNARLGDEEMEDLMQKMAVYLLTPSSSGFNQAEHLSSANDDMKGPEGLRRLWARFIGERTRTNIRSIHNEHREMLLDDKENDEGVKSDPMSQVEDKESKIDESYIRQVMKDLVSYIHAKAKPVMADMFDVWFELAQEKGITGPGSVDMKHDVYPVLRDKGHDGPDTTMATRWLELKRLIVKFFEKEVDGEVAPMVRKMLHVGSAEIVAYEIFRRRFAMWMLDGVIRM